MMATAGAAGLLDRAVDLARRIMSTYRCTNYLATVDLSAVHGNRITWACPSQTQLSAEVSRGPTPAKRQRQKSNTKGEVDRLFGLPGGQPHGPQYDRRKGNRKVMLLLNGTDTTGRPPIWLWRTRALHGAMLLISVQRQ